MVNMPDKKIIALVAAAVVAATVLFVAYDLNGDSFDFSDREARIVVTNSMDGHLHPDSYYHCNVCDAYWLPNNLIKLENGEHMDCPYAGCNSTNTEIVNHSFKIGKIQVDSLVMVHKLSANGKNALQVGDVIAFDHNGLYKVHRIIKLERDSNGDVLSITTSGDNTSGTENPTMNEIHGKVVGQSELLGGIVHFAKSSTLLFVMMIIIILVMISVIYDMYRMRQNDKKKEN